MQIIYIICILAVTCEAYDVFYVLPDNSANSSCPTWPCIALGEYLLDNSILPATMNVEYRFLPGKHQVTTKIMLQSLFNFSFVGIANKSSVVILNGKIQFINSSNVTIKNIVFKSEIEISQHSMIALNTCLSCHIKHVTLIQCGLICTNLIGKSYLHNITVHLTVIPSTLHKCYPIILLQYWDLPWVDHSELYTVTITQLSVNGNDNACHLYDPDSEYSGASIIISLYQTKYSLNILISDSLFYNMDQNVLNLKIKNNCSPVRNTAIITRCTFYFSKNFNPIVTSQGRMVADLSEFNATLTFLSCKFYYNTKVHLILITLAQHLQCITSNVTCLFLTNITINECYFVESDGGLLHFTSNLSTPCKVNICIIGPVFIYNCVYGVYLMYFRNTIINITGPLIIAYSNADNVIRTYSCDILLNGPVTMLSNYGCLHLMYFQYSAVLFNGNVTFESNQCIEIITVTSMQNHAYIKVMEYSVITLTNNIYSNLIAIETDNNQNKLYSFCFFQYISLGNVSLASTKHYAIVIRDKLFDKCKLSFPTSYCKWLNTTVFYGHNSGVINQEIIQVNHQPLNQHTTICHYSNCSVNSLGSVFPGQTLQTNLYMSCSPNISVLYAGTYIALLSSSACKIAHQTQLISVITNFSKIVNFTIVSEASHECELLLTVSPYLYDIYEAFSVQLSPCPIGFTLKNGKCECDPNLPKNIDTCYIDQSSVRRPTNTWITAQQQSNNTKYLIADCPMDYCLQYSSNVNLLYPDVQCQFSRTGVLCSQCKHPLSMVFGSSRCTKCSNLHILIGIMVIMVGIILVILFYLLNLTVTNGAINGIIFYANIVSINDSVFLVNDGIFKPLRVFISFVNLDLGIETCFYNGMDSYAKMWLQLFFPTYLIIIAVIIIIASRYSSRILRLTYTRSLPVLTTLFLLSYTGVLRTSLTVLFSYSSITHLPGGHKQLVWSIDASVSLFGFKFTVLFISCLLLFLILIPFNIILLFTRYLAQFNIINRYKPMLDAFQGSYKDKYYYWVAIHIIFRSLFFVLYVFQIKIRLILASIILVIFTTYYSYIHPYKHKMINFQELLLLINLSLLHLVSHQSSNVYFLIITNLMISLAFFQFCIILVYHFLTYTCYCHTTTTLQTVKRKLAQFCERKKPSHPYLNDIALLNIPEITYNYHEYQDGLVSDDFN